MLIGRALLRLCSSTRHPAQRLEPPRIDIELVQLERVAGRSGDDVRLGLEHPTKARNVALQHGTRVSRLFGPPELLAQPVGADHGAMRLDEHRQEQPRFGASDRHRLGAAAHFDVAQHANVQLGGHGTKSCKIPCRTLAEGRGDIAPGCKRLARRASHGSREMTSTHRNGTDMTTITNPNKALWEKGDFTRIAASMRTSGESLVKRIGIDPGLDVLDLGCGDGTTAIPAALAGANVRGIDIASNLVAAGNARVQQLGLSNCTFEEGDASNLVGVADDSFHLLVSIFGAMFAPRPVDTASEMVRVVRPGGRIVMGNWIPGDPTLVAQILRISGSYSPPPPEGFVSPMTWGVEDHIHERFVAAGAKPDSISCERDTYVFDFAGTPKEYVSMFRKYYGPTMNAFDAADANGRAADLQGELESLFEAHNTSTTTGRTVIPATFMRVTVTRLERSATHEPSVAALPGAYAGFVALWVGEDPEGRRGLVGHQRATRRECRSDALLGHIVRNGDVEMDAVALRARCIHLLEPERGAAAVRIDAVVVEPRLVAEHCLPERLHRGDVERVDRDLELGDGRWLRGDSELRGDRRDRPGKVYIAGGEPVGVVGGEQDVDAWIGDCQIGMVVHLVGSGADASCELDALGHRAGAERRLQGAQQHTPVLQSLALADLCGRALL